MPISGVPGQQATPNAINLELETLGQELLDTGHHSLARLLAAHIDVAVVGVAHETMAAHRPPQLGAAVRRGRCAPSRAMWRGKDQGVADAEWKNYCPNADTLLALKTGFERPWLLDFAPAQSPRSIMAIGKGMTSMTRLILAAVITAIAGAAQAQGLQPAEQRGLTFAFLSGAGLPVPALRQLAKDAGGAEAGRARSSAPAASHSPARALATRVNDETSRTRQRPARGHQ